MSISELKIKTPLPEDLTFSENGLIPAIIQHAETREVLMLGYMSRESLLKTYKSSKAVFYSRSRDEIWLKGETSGNFLNVVSVHTDCDSDALLVLAMPDGPTCHTGAKSCFFRPQPVAQKPLDFLSELTTVIEERKQKQPDESYVSSLFHKGTDKISQKVGEEAVETVIAAKNDDDGEFIYEASDLLFHLMVLLSDREMSLKTLVSELQNRHGKK
ncbi:MAG: bifunctional phosphoribosyl-AMP cyclohydrolase/phosphoribosyl-ATP diphosphatase HisIE [Balneolales bacterium]|nr:bifunctional phosphoribosyl-AMP cyclohydrolase/phosphoribosyl-ATP diphosphatase HisIE [Balneolales bacterium]